MVTKNEIKFVRSLHQKKFRQKYDKFIAEGEKIAAEIIKNSINTIDRIFVRKSWSIPNHFFPESINTKVYSVSEREMLTMSALKTPTNVLILLNKGIQNTQQLSELNTTAIYLDRIQNPGNIGTIMRTADWFGVKDIILSEGSGDIYNPKVIQASMGAFTNINFYTDCNDYLIANVDRVVIADGKGESLKEFEWPENTILVLGNEGQGVEEKISDQVKNVVAIEGAESRVSESLNVGIAAGILLSHMPV